MNALIKYNAACYCTSHGVAAPRMNARTIWATSTSEFRIFSQVVSNPARRKATCFTASPVRLFYQRIVCRLLHQDNSRSLWKMFRGKSHFLRCKGWFTLTPRDEKRSENMSLCAKWTTEHTSAWWELAKMKKKKKHLWGNCFFFKLGFRIFVFVKGLLTHTAAYKQGQSRCFLLHWLLCSRFSKCSSRSVSSGRPK